VSVSRPDRISWIEWEDSSLSIKEQAALLGLNRTGLYYKPKEPGERELAIKHCIDEIFTECPFYGSRRVAAQLRREGIRVNRLTVRRYMREMGLETICPKPNLSKPGQGKAHKVYPYLLKELKLVRPNQVWGIDITYLRLKRGWMYLVAIIDWHSRYIISYELDQTLEIGFVLEAVARALAQAQPDILNSDQGGHFTSAKYTHLVRAAGVRISMDGRGRAFDNIFTERFWRSLKYEAIYLNEIDSPKEMRRIVGEYIEFYNNRRVHQALGYKTPAQVHFASLERVG